jgi:hypothetical protein
MTYDDLKVFCLFTPTRACETPLVNGTREALPFPYPGGEKKKMEMLAITTLVVPSSMVVKSTYCSSHITT